MTDTPQHVRGHHESGLGLSDDAVVQAAREAVASEVGDDYDHRWQADAIRNGQRDHIGAMRYAILGARAVTAALRTAAPDDLVVRHMAGETWRGIPVTGWVWDKLVDPEERVVHGGTLRCFAFHWSTGPQDDQERLFRQSDVERLLVTRTAASPDFETWAAEWHRTVETICTIVGVSGSGSPTECVEAVRDALDKARTAAPAEPVGVPKAMMQFAERWRDDAFEKSAEIVDRWFGIDGNGCAADIRALIATVAPPAADASGVAGPSGFYDLAPLTFTYRNYRGEMSERHVLPISTRLGLTEWHPERQWLLLAFDLDKKAEREFAMKDIGAAQPSPGAPDDLVERLLHHADEQIDDNLVYIQTADALMREAATRIATADATIEGLRAEVEELRRENGRWQLIAGASDVAQEAQLAGVEAERDAWKEVARKAGVCMTCALNAPEPYGCTDCLNTGWEGGAPINVEAIARILSLSYGEDPDADAPRSTICGPNNELLPCWMAYEEQGQALVPWFLAVIDRLEQPDPTLSPAAPEMGGQA